MPITSLTAAIVFISPWGSILLILVNKNHTIVKFMKRINAENRLSETHLLIHIKGRKRIFYEHILMLRATSNYTQILMRDGSTYLSSTTLGILEKRLPDTNFFRLNRSEMINLKYIENFKINAEKIGVVRLKENTQELLVSRRRKPLLINILIKESNRSKKY